MAEDTVHAELLDERREFSLREIVRICDITPDQLIEWVAEGIVAPSGEDPLDWRFTGTHLVRVQTGLRLQRDLGLDYSGTALVLELLDDLRELRRRLQRLGGEL